MLVVKKKLSFINWLLSLSILLFVAGCGGSSTDNGEDKPVVSIQNLSISPFEITLFANETRQLELRAFYSDNTVSVITGQAEWSSSNELLVDVTADGVITALDVGVVKITAVFQGHQSSVSVVVSEAALTEIEISPVSVQLPAGTEQLLTATGLFSDLTIHSLEQGVNWQSSDNNIATVSAAGVVRAVAPGLVEISAALSGVNKTISVEVTAATVISISFSPSSIALALGEERSLTIYGHFSDGTTKDITEEASLISASPAVVEVDADSAGRLIAKSTGNTALLASLSGINQQINVVVSAAVISELDISLTKNSVPLGVALSLNVIARYTDGTSKNLTEFAQWSSSDQAVAGINSHGVLHSISKGIVEVSAVYGGKKASITIQITDAILTSIEIAPLIKNIPMGMVQSFTASGIYSDQSVQDITDQVVWLSSDNTVMSVSNSIQQKGQVTALKTGSVIISAQKDMLSGEQSVVVTDAVLSSISIKPENTTLPIGVTESLNAIAQYSDGSSRDISSDVIWASSDPKIAATENINSSEFTAISIGTVNISASFEGQSGFTQLQVTDAVLASILIDTIQSEVAKGIQLQLTATGYFSDATTKDLTEYVEWSSSDQTVAVINAVEDKGLLTAIEKGSATLSATLSGISDSKVITITDAVLIDLSVIATTNQLTVGQQLQLSAQGAFSDSSIQDLTGQVVWKTSDNTVAAVSNTEPGNGLLTALAAGSAEVTVELQSISSQPVSIDVMFDPHAPVSISLSAYPNVILNNNSDAAVVSAILQPADISGVIADGTEVAFTVTEDGISSELITTTTNGVASVQLSTAEKGVISISATVVNTELVNSATVVAVSSFNEILLKAAFLNPVTDNTSLLPGTTLGLLVQNLSNRSFDMDSFFVTNNSVHLSGSPFDASLVGDGQLTAGERVGLIYQLTESIVPNNLVTGLLLSESVTSANFGFYYPFIFAQ